MTFAPAALRGRWLALARRERGLALLAALVLVLGLGELVFIEPTLTQRARLVREMQARQREQQALQQHLGGGVRDPNAPLRVQLDGLQTQVRATEREFHALQNGLVQPQHMGSLLQSLLTEHRGLRLLGLRSLPVTPIGDSGGVRKIMAANERAGSVPSSAAPASASGGSPCRSRALRVTTLGSTATPSRFASRAATPTCWPTCNRSRTCRAACTGAISRSMPASTLPM